MLFKPSDLWDKAVALLFALAPFFQHYNMPGIGVNLEFFLVFFVGGLYAAINVLIQRKGAVRPLITASLFLMTAYIFVNQILGGRHVYQPSVTNIANIVSFFIVLSIAAVAFLNANLRKHYFRYVENIACFMAVVVFVQLVFFYVFGNPVSTDRSFLFPFQSQFTDGVKNTLATSQMVINGLFRPSAFFIEPAHYSQFCTIGLVCALVRENKLFNKKAAIISAGIILTTSGMGILSVALIWGTFLYINAENAGGITEKTVKRILVGTCILLIVAIGLYTFSGAFRSAIARIFVASNGYNSAILGRAKNVVLIKKLSPAELFFGMGFKNIPTYRVGGFKTQYYMTGIFELIYCQGIVGTSIFLICYVYMLVKAFRMKQNLPFFILIAYIPFLLGSSNLVMLTLIQYIPFLYIPRKKSNPSNRYQNKRIYHSRINQFLMSETS